MASRYTVEGEGFTSVNDGNEWSYDPNAPPVDTGAIWRAAGEADLRQRIVEALREEAHKMPAGKPRSVYVVYDELADRLSAGWPEKEGTR